MPFITNPLIGKLKFDDQDELKNKAWAVMIACDYQSAGADVQNCSGTHPHIIIHKPSDAENLMKLKEALNAVLAELNQPVTTPTGP